MAMLTCKFRSEALVSMAEVKVFLPTDRPENPSHRVAGVVTLLHGYSNDCDCWVENTAAVRYARDNDLALVIPTAGNSFYQDMAAGPAWQTWLARELPEQLERNFCLPAQREKNFVFGLSMGGYGALLLALRYPDRFAAAASFSGCVDVGMMLEARKVNPLVQEVFGPVFGTVNELPRQADLYALGREVSALPAARQPRLFCTVGKQDYEPYYIYNQNIALREAWEKLPLDFGWMEWDGAHEWDVWDRSLVFAIDRFIAPGYAEKIHAAWAAPVTGGEGMGHG